MGRYHIRNGTLPGGFGSGGAMIICHCTGLTDRDIRDAIDWMRLSDPLSLVTPGRVYRALGKRPDCGGCLPLFLQEMARCESMAVAPGPRVPVLRNRKENRHER